MAEFNQRVQTGILHSCNHRGLGWLPALFQTPGEDRGRGGSREGHRRLPSVGVNTCRVKSMGGGV